MTAPAPALPPRPAEVVQADIQQTEARLQQLRDELSTAQWLAQYDGAPALRLEPATA